MKTESEDKKRNLNPKRGNQVERGKFTCLYSIKRVEYMYIHVASFLDINVQRVEHIVSLRQTGLCIIHTNKNPAESQ